MISSERWYLTADNIAVRDGHPDARTLLVGAGCEIPDSVARQYGIAGGTDETREKSLESAPENKALEMPSENKRRRVRK